MHIQRVEEFLNGTDLKSPLIKTSRIDTDAPPSLAAKEDRNTMNSLEGKRGIRLMTSQLLPRLQEVSAKPLRTKPQTGAGYKFRHLGAGGMIMRP